MKKAVLIASTFVAFTICLWFKGPSAYRHFEETGAIEQASRFLQRGDGRNASLSARQALRLNPQNVDACRIMAQLAEAAGSAQAVDWRQHILELSPTIDNKLALASAAVRLEPPPNSVAVQTLTNLEGFAEKLPSYHVIAAELALKSGQPQNAERHLEEAAQLEPTNDLHRLNLAVLRLGSVSTERTCFAKSWSQPDSSSESLLVSNSNQESDQVLPARSRDTLAESRMTLEALRNNSRYAPTALRALTSDALRRRDFADAERFSDDLLSCSQSELNDRLRHLSILRELKKAAEFAPFLESLQSNVSTNARGIYAVASWMIRNGLETEAMSWLSRLAPGMRAEPLVNVAVVQAYASRHDWSGMEAFLTGQKWDGLEFLRNAWLSQTAWQQKRSNEAQAHWRLAVQQAGERLGPLTILLSMAEPCGQERGIEDVLWRIVQRFPNQKWASAKLHKWYLKEGNTVGLNRLYDLMTKQDPKDWVAKNNFAATSMLLQLNLVKAHELALELYREKPQESVVASTYAYSLQLEGRTKDALGILEKCPPLAFNNPALALYYGVILAADGQTNAAERFLNIARNGDLLPEEKRMLR